jgi:hypothetical protein
MIGSHTRETDYHFQRVQSRETAEAKWDRKEPWGWRDAALAAAFAVFLVSILMAVEWFEKIAEAVK